MRTEEQRMADRIRQQEWRARQEVHGRKPWTIYVTHTEKVKIALLLQEHRKDLDDG
jgi:hypothetical protein